MTAQHATRATGVLVAALFASWLAAPTATPRPTPASIQFFFTSDAHYGLTRQAFERETNVPAFVVNRAMVARMNALPGTRFPKDAGLRAGELIGPVDFVAHTGDIANRSEGAGKAAIQSAATSWSQFVHDYIDGLRLKAPTGERSALYVVPGNHDASNAIGHHKLMTPTSDPSAIIGIYNLMMRPPQPLTIATYAYRDDPVRFSRDVGGLHLLFVGVWPDSSTRDWMDTDLAHVAPDTPVLLFTHDQPEVEAKHFINPNGRHDINAVDLFENLLSDQFADGTTIDARSDVEQRGLEAFLRRHPNVTAYFHGNSNWNQFYDWAGPDGTAQVHVFRVDSPMKGAVSAADQTKLSFHVATVDMTTHQMTVRECLWNPTPSHPRSVAWGTSRTVSLAPRLALAYP